MTSQDIHPDSLTDYRIYLEIDEPYRPDVDTVSISDAVTATFRCEGISRASVTVVITDDQEMRELNLTYRGINASTDVLSFASQEHVDEEPGVTLPAELLEEMNTYLGDIVIAFPYAARQAKQFGNPVAAELRLLAVHGVLHLLGYDHDYPAAEARMWAIQDAVLATFGDQSPSQRTYGP